MLSATSNLPPNIDKIEITRKSWLLKTQLPIELTEVDTDALWSLCPKTPSFVVLYNKTIEMPRRIQSYRVDYRFSGITHKAIPLPEEFVPFADWVDSIGLGLFDQVLVNWYENGNQYIGSHADSEGQLVSGSPIITISLGASRTFRIRKNGKIVHDEIVEHGTVVAMCGSFQQELKHEIPKIAGKKGKNHGRRISITFRKFSDLQID